MIALLIGMLRARPVQAITVFLLSAVATAAAVAGPVALGAVDQSIIRKEVAGASNVERSISVTGFVNPSNEGGPFDTLASLLRLPGFEAIRAGEFEVFGPVAEAQEAFGSPTSRLAFRDRICEHIVMVSGRCLAGPLEVVLGEDTAKRAGLRPGDTTIVQAARYVEGRGLLPDGEPAPLTVVGVYRPRDPAEAYWAGQRYFPVMADGTRREAVFTTVQTIDLVEHSLGQSSIDTLAPAGALTLLRFETLPDEVARVLEPIAEDQLYAVETEIPALAERIRASRDSARQLVPVAFVPLVAISFFVIFLAVGHGIFGRRQELGMVTLRGVRPVRRWWLATGETLVAVVAGAPVGYLLGHAAVAAVAAWRLGAGDGAGVSPRTVPYALLALVGSLVVALLGQRRSLSEPVVDLLRGVPRASARWQSLVVEALVLTMAAVATWQLRNASGGLAGVALLVPGLVVVAVALVAARALAPVAGTLARVALRRGWLGSGLAAVQIARRPGSQRLFVLLAVASAMLAFVAAGVDVASRAREDRARIVTGANTVLSVDQADVGRLLHVTRTADPDGNWAMAAMTVDQSDDLAPPVLAVDTARLAAVATWRPEFGASPEAIAEFLRASPAGAFAFRGTSLTVDLQMFAASGEPPLDLNLTFIPLTGGDRVVATVADVVGGRAVRQVNVSGCRDGCRFTSVSIPDQPTDSLVRLVLYAMLQADPPAEVIPAAALADRARWRTSEAAEISTYNGGLQIVADPSPFNTGDVTISAIDSRLPVPVAMAGSLDARRLTGLDNQFVPVEVVRQPAMLPRLAAYGALVDLEYLQLTSLSTPRRGPAEVWLGPAAPPDAAERLRLAGLAVSGATGLDQARVALARQGPALAVQFHVAAAAIGVVLALGGLGLMAAVDRRQRGDDFRSLRRQGVPRRVVSRASFGGYLAIVLAATMVGLGASAAAWWAAGDRLPVFTDSVDSLPPPRWPVVGNVVQAWSYAAAGMVLAALIAGLLLRWASTGSGSMRQANRGSS
jgi:hypothetical protein